MESVEENEPKKAIFSGFLKTKGCQDICNGHVFPYLMFFDLVRLERVSKRFGELSKYYKSKFPLYLTLPARMFCPNYRAVQGAKKFLQVVAKSAKKAMKDTPSGLTNILIVSLGCELAKSMEHLSFAKEIKKNLLYPYLEKIKNVAKKHKIVGFECDPTCSTGCLAGSYNSSSIECAQRLHIEALSVDSVRQLDEIGLQEEVVPLLKDLETFKCPRLNLKKNRPLQPEVGEIYDISVLPKKLKELSVSVDIDYDDSIIKRIVCRFQNLETLNLNCSLLHDGKDLNNILNCKKLKTLILYYSRFKEGLKVCGDFVKGLPASVTFFALLGGNYGIGENCEKETMSAVNDFKKVSEFAFRKRGVQPIKGKPGVCSKYPFGGYDGLMKKVNLIGSKVKGDKDTIFLFADSRLISLRIVIVISSGVPIKLIEDAFSGKSQEGGV
jgi:hypothetical protein